MTNIFLEPGVYVTTDEKGSTAIRVSGHMHGNMIYFYLPPRGWGWMGITWTYPLAAGKEMDRYRKLDHDEWPEWLPLLPR